MKRWKEDLKGIGTLDYFVFKDIPMRDSKWGPVIEVREQILEELALRALVTRRIPLHGAELKFIRKALGFTIQEFAKKLRLTHGAIQGWEKGPKTRLLPVNEIAVRSLVAEELKIDILGHFSELLGTDSTPKRIELLAS
jgi:DNA-binding transcriptional regulator YiaG